jgi:hypothetical protein
MITHRSVPDTILNASVSRLHKIKEFDIISIKRNGPVHSDPNDLEIVKKKRIGSIFTDEFYLEFCDEFQEADAPDEEIRTNLIK